jgi:ABC-type molybdate transport system permease subunit
LAFAHTMGEFGVVLMIGGNIPGVTRTVSISIYDQVEASNYAGGQWDGLAAVSLLLRRPHRGIWSAPENAEAEILARSLTE